MSEPESAKQDRTTEVCRRTECEGGSEHAFAKHLDPLDPLYCGDDAVKAAYEALPEPVAETVRQLLDELDRSVDDECCMSLERLGLLIRYAVHELTTLAHGVFAYGSMEATGLRDQLAGAIADRDSARQDLAAANVKVGELLDKVEVGDEPGVLSPATVSFLTGEPTGPSTDLLGRMVTPVGDRVELPADDWEAVRRAIAAAENQRDKMTAAANIALDQRDEAVAAASRSLDQRDEAVAKLTEWAARKYAAVAELSELALRADDLTPEDAKEHFDTIVDAALVAMNARDDMTQRLDESLKSLVAVTRERDEQCVYSAALADEANRLREALDKAEQTVARQNGVILRGDAEVVDIRAALRAQVEKNDTLRAGLTPDKIGDELKQAREAAAQDQRRVRVMADQVESARRAELSWSKRVDESDERVEALDELLRTALAERGEISAELADCEARLASAIANADRWKSAYFEMLKTADGWRKTHDELTAVVGALRSDLATSQRSRDEHDALWTGRWTGVQSRITELTVERDEANRTIETLNGTMRKNGAELGQLREALKQARETIGLEAADDQTTI